MRTIGDNAFLDCSGLTGSLTIPNSVTTIGDKAFAYCSGFTGDLTIGNSVTTIGDNAFAYCSGFTGDLTIPNSVTTIESDAFYHCSGLTGELTIPNSVTKIGSYAFCGCDGFTGTLTLGSSLTNIGEGAFLCDGFNDVVSLNINPPSPPMYYAGNGATIYYKNGNNERRTLYVPAESVNAYKESYIFKNFSPIYPLEYQNSEVIEITPKKMTMLVGEICRLTAVIVNIPDKTVTWSSSDSEIVSISNNGRGEVRGLKGGQAVITATASNGLTATCDITVVQPVRRVYLNKYDVKVMENEIVQLTATIEPEDTTDKSVVWSSSDEAVATVDANGLVTAIKQGKATITASTENGLKATCAITVVAATVDAAGLTLNLEEAEIIENNTLQLTATVTPADATDKTVTWSSSDEAVAIVDATSLVTAIKPGKATITASTENGLKATCTVTVVAATVDAAGLTLNLEEAEIIQNNTLQLTATITPTDATDKTVTWSSSDEAVATVNANGLVTAKSVGTATITASTANGFKATCTVTVAAKPAGIEGVEAEEESAVRVEGGNIIAPEGSEVFDLNGRRVSAKGLSSGIYIVRIPGAKAIKVIVK
ncbi:MAG: Ig-like domain-containing protein [Paramuribaculum sp.]|nr:Ig-like domain-containing protein [Paramuribaculum sp.]